MPIVLEDEFHVFADNYSDFIRRHHADVLQHCRFHDRMGVVGPVGRTQPWRWSVVRITNDIGRTIEVAKSLESLWLYGYRRRPPREENHLPNPWRVINDLEEGFSGLPGDSRPLNFSGKYPITMKLNVSKFSLGNAITELDNYAKALNNGGQNLNPDRARKAFVMLILYFAEALKIIPVRNFLETRFAKDDGMVFLPSCCMDLATNWSTNSRAFLSGDQYVGQEMWLVLYPKRGQMYELDGVQPVDQPEEPDDP